jgi:hypothetical protein
MKNASLYTVPGGLLFYCECAESISGNYVFPAAKTLQIILTPQADGSTRYVMQRLDKTFGYPSQLKLARIGVLASDCTDENIVLQAQAALSGLILPGRRQG